MPPASICQSCPTQEYKTLKKKLRKRRAADEVCTEKGEGVWQDTTDCTKYYICRSMSTTWAEKKHETCYSGSYFDPKGGQCKWVGQGNYNCDTILGKDADESGGQKSKKDEEDETTKSPESEPSSSSDGESSSLSGTDGIKNRQKIFYELSATNSKQQSALADGIIPPNLYTCKAEVSVEYESNSDYVKCYSCEADSKSIAKCQETPNANSTLVIWCYAKTQKCFSKALYNTSNKNEIISFTRGCTSVSDMASSTSAESNSDTAAATTTTTTNAPAGSAPLSNCVQRSSSTKACYIMCDKNLCNTHDDLKSGASKHSLKSTLTYLVTFMYISLQMTSLINTLL